MNLYLPPYAQQCYRLFSFSPSLQEKIIQKNKKILQKVYCDA